LSKKSQELREIIEAVITRDRIAKIDDEIREDAKKVAILNQEILNEEKEREKEERKMRKEQVPQAQPDVKKDPVDFSKFDWNNDKEKEKHVASNFIAKTEQSP